MICNSCGLQYDFCCDQGCCTSCCISEFHGYCNYKYKQGFITPVISLDIGNFSSETSCYCKNVKYVINIHNSGLITLSQFKKMFYSKTLKKISPDNSPESDLSANHWICPEENTHINNTGSDFQTYHKNALNLKKNHEVQWIPQRSDRNKEWVYVYKRGKQVKLGGEYGWIPKEILQQKPNTKYCNYNNLGGNDNKIFALPYLHDIPVNGSYKPFKAQETILNNIKNDLGVELRHWDLCSRTCIYDQLYNLSFVREKSSLKLNCGRSWKEIIDILSHSQIFNLFPGKNFISFSQLPNNFRTAKYIFRNSPITRISYDTRCDNLLCKELCKDSSGVLPGVFIDASFNNNKWTYLDANGDSKEWNLQTNITYMVETPISKLWAYKIVNRGDYICAQVNVQIYNNHPDININTIKINYFCLVDREPEDC